GRIDICLTDPNAVAPAERHPAVVELKALRSRSSSGEAISERQNLAAVAGGMRQAKSYRVTKKAIVGVLACFDLRQTKTDLLGNETVKKALVRYYDDRMAVTLLPIYGLPEDAQEEVAAACPVGAYFDSTIKVSRSSALPPCCGEARIDRKGSLLIMR